MNDGLLCDLACLAYTSLDVVRAALVRAGWSTVLAWNHGDTQAYLVRKFHADETITSVLVFRGTELRWRDLVTDIAIWGTVGPDGFGPVHSGFRNALDFVWPDIVSYLVQERKHLGELTVCGHSLGGALADLAGAFLIASAAIRNPVAVVTFGAPRVGGVQYTRAYRQRFAGRHVRYINGADWVPSHPWALWGYRHAGTAIHLGRGRWEGRLRHPLTAGSRAHRCAAYVRRVYARQHALTKKGQ